MKNILVLIFLLVACPVLLCQNPSIEEVLAKSLQYHDPNNEWPSFSGELKFEESRPDGTVRNTTVWIDNSKGYFKINRNDDEVHGMLMDSCFIETGDVNCDRVETLRNYYTYLWGLPMKLHHDKPDNISLVESEEEQYIIQVVYEKDTWDFMIEKESFKMTAYRFVKNDNPEKGEFIGLEGELSVGSMKIPSSRTWYELPEEKLLGTDKLVSFQPFIFEN
ncbi:MAG: DUF6503 family protein [bacterium]|nr:DUF6503 family protein [bacterium]